MGCKCKRSPSAFLLCRSSGDAVCVSHRLPLQFSPGTSLPQPGYPRGGVPQRDWLVLLPTPTLVHRPFHLKSSLLQETDGITIIINRISEVPEASSHGPGPVLKDFLLRQVLKMTAPSVSWAPGMARQVLAASWIVSDWTGL